MGRYIIRDHRSESGTGMRHLGDLALIRTGSLMQPRCNVPERQHGMQICHDVVSPFFSAFAASFSRDKMTVVTKAGQDLLENHRHNSRVKRCTCHILHSGYILTIGKRTIAHIPSPQSVRSSRDSDMYMTESPWVSGQVLVSSREFTVVGEIRVR